MQYYHGYHARLAFYIVVPFVIAAIIMAVVAARCSVTDGHLSVQRLSLSATPALLKLAFLAYPLVTNVV